MPPLRYRIYEPETPRDLPTALFQEWTSDLRVKVGAEMVTAHGTWRIAAVEDDPDPAFAGRVYFEVTAIPPEESTGAGA